MKRKRNHLDNLRQKAEVVFRRQAALSLTDIAALPLKKIQQLFHELQVHQIELEIQNEELRTAQEQLNATRARYFDLYDLAPVGYCTLSESGLILEANLTAATLLGTNRSAMVKQPISRFIYREDQDLYYLRRKQLFESDQPQEFDLRLVKGDGTTFWAQLTATAAQDSNGAPVCRAVISDITERKQAEAKIRQFMMAESLSHMNAIRAKSERRFSELVDLLPQTVFEMDTRGKIAFVNRQGFQMFGYDPEDIARGIRAIDMLVPEDRNRVQEIFRTRLGGERTRLGGERTRLGDAISTENEYTARRKDGTTFPVLIYTSPIFVKKRTVGLRGIAIDITARKRAETQRLVYQQQLRSLAGQVGMIEQRERRQIAAELHDRTGQALATALLKVQMVKNRELMPEIADALEDIRLLIDQAYQDTRSLIFEISPPVLYEVGLTAALKQLANEMRRQRGLHVIVKDDEQVNPQGEDLRVFLFRAVRELLNNAVKHAQTDEIAVTLCRDGDQIRVEVADEGVGFDTSRLEFGASGIGGFGLFNIRERLDFMGGTFQVKSKPGKGTQIVMELPLHHITQGGADL